MPFNDTIIGQTVSNDLVLLLNSDNNKPTVTVGQSIQPDVAHFLADSYPWVEQMMFLPYTIDDFSLLEEELLEIK